MSVVLGCGAVERVRPPSEQTSPEVLSAVARADGLLNAGDMEGALVLLEGAHARAPDNVPVMRSLQDVLIELDRAEEARALAELRLERRRDPNSLALLARLEDNERARALLNEAIGLDPGCFWAQYSLGVLDARDGRFGDALERFDASLEAWPAFEQALRARAQLHDQIGNFEFAVRDFRQILEDDPSDVDARVNLASILHRELDRSEEAEQQYRILLDADPELTSALVGLAACRTENQDATEADFLEAEQLLRRAYDREPAAMYDLGLLYEGPLSRPEDAMRCFQEFIDYEGPGAERRGIADRLLFAPVRVEELRQRIAGERGA